MAILIAAIAAVTILGLPAPVDPPDGAPAATAGPPPVAEAPPPAAQEPTATAPADPAMELLERLERSAEDLRAFVADVVYEAEDELIGRRETRRGTLVYQADASSGDKRFAVLFSTIDRNGRRERRPKHYVFDGQWLAEIDAKDRQFIKRQIVPPGERLDPLKLGEGPFPLPVGQPAGQVLARFEASLMPMPTEGPLARVPAVYEQLDGLLLIPRTGTAEAKDYERVELLYDRATMLPVGINVVETSGDRKTVRLRNPQRNPELDAEALETLQIEDPDPREWSISVQPWKG
ncbi:MAG: LolA family protein [Planctomycetota bacterium]|jgi:hypothetical protein